MIGIAVMGCGVVGSGTVKMLTQNAENIARATGKRTRLLTVMDIRVIAPPQGAAYTNRFEDILNDPEISIAVETIGGLRAAYEYTKRLLEAGTHVVTSNKELVAEKGDELIALARKSGARYLYEAAVGGAIPILRPISLCLAGNRFQSIEGIVNGSTNYMLTRMEVSGASFSAAIEEARDLGYVEGNPAADIDGLDAKRKLAILAHDAMGARFSDQALIPCDGIRDIVPEDIRAAALFGGRLKLIARANAENGQWNGSVRVRFVAAEHALYGVNDVYNAVVLHTDFAGDTMLYGRGAGSMPTASAVVGDIIDIAKNMDCKPSDERPACAYRAKDESARWLMRLTGAYPKFAGEIREGDGVRAILTPPMTEAELLRAVDGAVHSKPFPAL